MERFSPDNENVNDEIEEGCWKLNRGSQMYMGMKLLESHLRQLGFRNHELQIVQSFIFVIDGDREHKKYVWWRRLEKRALKGLFGITVSQKDFEHCVDRISELIQSGEFDMQHASN